MRARARAHAPCALSARARPQLRDLETIQTELCAKDLQYVLRAIDDEKKDVKRSQGMKLSSLFIETLDRVQKMLEDNLPIRDGTWSTPEVEMIRAK